MHGDTTGGTNNLGNIDTQGAATGWLNFLGIEGVYGGFYEIMGNITNNSGVWTISGIGEIPQRTITVPTTYSGGYVKGMAAEAGGYFDLCPIVYGGSATTYYTTFAEIFNSGSFSVARAGSNSETADKQNITRLTSIYNMGDSSAYYSSRLSFRGIITEATSVAAFKNLPVQ
jgi:hypothetical protein